MAPRTTAYSNDFTVMPAITNHMVFQGNQRRIIFGGAFMSEIDLTCARLAKMVIMDSHTATMVFTHKVEIEFVAPAREGDTVTIETRLTALSNRGLEISFKAYAQNSEYKANNFSKQVAHGKMVFVAHNGDDYVAHGLEM